MVKNLPTIRETWVQSLGWQDPLEQGMATHSSILAREIPWTEEPGGLWGRRELDRTEQLSIHTWILGMPAPRQQHCSGLLSSPLAQELF